MTKIIDKNDNVVENPDLSLGYLRPDRLLVAHHDAVQEAPAKVHEEIIKRHDDGHVTTRLVIDSPATQGDEAWDEYEEVMRYIEYTPGEIAELSKPSQMDIIEAQVSYTAMMTDTLLEV